MEGTQVALRILAECEKELEEVGENEVSPVEDNKSGAASYLTEAKLARLGQDIRTAKQVVSQLQHSKHYGTLSERTRRLLDHADEKSYANSKVLVSWLATFAGEGEKESQEKTVTTEEDTEEELAVLRHRLLSRSTQQAFDEGADTGVEKANSYHESIQEDILNELSGFASNLKESALRFSSKLLEDNKTLNETTEKLMKNETLMKNVGSNLNNYVLDKTGGKVSIWFLMKVLLGSILLFLLMVLLVRILPKM